MSKDESYSSPPSGPRANTYDQVPRKEINTQYAMLTGFRFKVDKLAESLDHNPHAHPASPTHTLPDSFASYRSKAQQHGPLGGQASLPSSTIYDSIGGHAGRALGSIKPKEGEFFDRSELPARFRKKAWSEEEIEAVTSAGASLF
jgi:small subunit ribosomal protein YMR-31